MADFDVSMRLGIDYRPEDARKARQDLEAIRKAADRLGGGAGLVTDLDKAGTAAKALETRVKAIDTAADRLGAGGGVDRLKRDVLDVGEASKRVERDVEDLDRAADRLGASEGPRKIRRDFLDLAQSTKSVEDYVDRLNSAAARLGVGKGPDRLRRDVLDVGSASKRTKRDVDGVRDAVDLLGRATGVDEMRRDFDAADRSARQFEDRIDRVRRASSRLGVGGRGGGGGRRSLIGRDGVEEGLQVAGLGALGPIVSGPQIAIGAAVGGAAYGGYKSVTQAMSVETAMASVKRSMNNPTDTQLTAVEAGIARLSVQTGKAKEEIAALIAEAAKAGTAYEDLLDVADFGQKFGIAAEMSSAEAGSQLSYLRNGFQMTSPQLKDTADVINYVADNTSGSESGILQFMNRVGAQAGLVNMSPKDVAAFGATFEGANTDPAVAGTGMNALLQRLGNAPGTARADKDFGRALGMIGTSPRQMQADLLKDPTEAIIGVLEKIQKLPQDRRLQAYEGLGGLEYGDDFAKLATQIPQLRQALGYARSPDSKGSVDATFSVYNSSSETAGCASAGGDRRSWRRNRQELRAGGQGFRPGGEMVRRRDRRQDP